MAAKKEIEKHLKIAIHEIGEIEPWFDREVNEWIFSHPLYPVEYGGKSKEEVIENYPKYLREFIAHRLENLVEKETKGRGGARAGAGRPKGKRLTTQVIRLEASIAKWVKEHQNEIHSLISGEKILVPTKAQKKGLKSPRV